MSKNFSEQCLNVVENKGVEPLTPCVQGRCSKPTELIPQTYIVVPGRVELPTSTLSVWRSNQLSYRTGLAIPNAHLSTDLRSLYLFI